MRQHNTFFPALADLSQLIINLKQIWQVACIGLHLITFASNYFCIKLPLSIHSLLAIKNLPMYGFLHVDLCFDLARLFVWNISVSFYFTVSHCFVIPLCC